MREMLKEGYERLLLVVGWTGIIMALALLALGLAFHLDYSPFVHPGAPPGSDRIDLLKLDGIRWFLTAIVGSICGMRHTPTQRRDQGGRELSGWIAYPIGILMGVMVMATASTVCWFLWMERLPGGDRMENALLCGLYFAIPAALLFTFMVYVGGPRRDS